MYLLIALGFIAVYLAITGIFAKSTTRFNFGFLFFVVAGVFAFIKLKAPGGFLFTLGMAVAFFLFWFLRLLNVFGKATQAIEIEGIKQKHLEEEFNKKAGGNPQKAAELKEQYSEFVNEQFVPGKASHFNNKPTGKVFTVSTLARQVEFDFDGKEYSSTVESAIFEGKNSKVKPAMTVQFLGGVQRDVKVAHKLVTSAVSKELPSGFTNGDWWTEYLRLKHLKATPSEDYQPWYDETMTTVFVTK